MTGLVAVGVMLVAVCFEVFGDSMMKLSDGYRRKLPLIGVLFGYGVSFYLISLTLEAMPLGVVYAMWNSLGIALTAVVATVVWKESFNRKKLIGVILVIASVAILELGM